MRGAIACAVLAACGGAAHPHTADDAARAAAVAHAEPFIVASGAIGAITGDASHVYWSDEAGIHQRDTGGKDAKGSLLAPRPDKYTITQLAIAGDTAIVSDGQTVLALHGKDAPKTLLEAGATVVIAIAIAGNDVIVARTDQIVRVPIAGGAAKTIASHLTRVVAIAVDADNVYWTDYGGEPSLPPPPPGSQSGTGGVWRAPLAGGSKPKPVAGEQAGPTGIAIVGGRVWWTDDQSPGVQSAKLDGSDRKVEREAPADRLAVDAGAMIVHTPASYLVEASGKRAQLRFAPDGTFTPSATPPVVAPRWIFALASRSDGSSAVLAVPRDPDAPLLALPTAGSVGRMHVRDGNVFWLETRRDTSAIDLVRGEPHSGQTHHLTSGQSYGATDFALADDRVYLLDSSIIYAIPNRGGSQRQFAAAQQYISGVTVHHDHVFWVDGGALMAKQRGNGSPFAVAHAPPNYGPSEYPANIVFDDNYAYIVNFANPGITRISEQGVTEPLGDGYSPAGKDLVKIGDDLYYFGLSSGTIFRVSMDGTSTQIYTARGVEGDTGYIYGMVGGAGELYACVEFSSLTMPYWEVVRIDPSQDEATGKVVLRWYYGGADNGNLAADDTALYVPIDQLGAIVVLRHDAPTLPDGWK